MSAPVPLIVKANRLDWMRLWIVVGTVAVIWSGLATLIPEPYYRVTMTILTAVQAGITFAMRAGKYVKDRRTVPPAGEDP